VNVHITQTQARHRELWVVTIDAARDHGGMEPTYLALFGTYSGEDLGHVYACELRRTPLSIKESITRRPRGCSSRSCAAPRPN